MQVSFVNSICTVKGGTHVDYIVNQITKCAQAMPQHATKGLTMASMLIVSNPYLMQHDQKMIRFYMLLCLFT